MNQDLAKALEELEMSLPEEMRTVVTDNTVAAEREFLRQKQIESFGNGGRQLTRMHVSWGPQAKEMSVDQLVEYLWKIDQAPKIEHTEWEEEAPKLKKPPVDVRDFLSEN